MLLPADPLSAAVTGRQDRERGRTMDQPTAERVLAALEPLVGSWTFVATWPDGTPWPGEGRVTFAWHPSGAHLVQEATVDWADAPDNVSVIGCDGARGTYVQVYSDERGVCRLYDMSIGDGEWRLWRQGEPFSQRFTGRFSEDGDTITARWEAAEDHEHYVTDFDLVYTRVR